MDTQNDNFPSYTVPGQHMFTEKSNWWPLGFPETELFVILLQDNVRLPDHLFHSSELLFPTMPDTIAALKRRADALDEENRRLRVKLTKTSYVLSVMY